MKPVNLYKLPKDILVKLLVEKYNPDIFTLKELSDFQLLLSERERKLINERQDYFTDLFKDKYFPVLEVTIKFNKKLSTYRFNLLTYTFSRIYIVSHNDNEFTMFNNDTTIDFYKQNGDWELKRRLYYDEYETIDMDLKKEFIKIYEDRKELLDKWNSY